MATRGELSLYFVKRAIWKAVVLADWIDLLGLQSYTQSFVDTEHNNPSPQNRQQSRPEVWPLEKLYFAKRAIREAVVLAECIKLLGLPRYT